METSAPAPAAVLAELERRIDANQLALPSLPDIALRLQKAFDDPNVATDEIVRIVTADPPIAAEIVKAANSPLLRGNTPVATVGAAIPRLGYRALRTMVLNLALERSFRTGNSLLTHRLRAFWEHSRAVAANARALAARVPGLDRDTAMLAGLVHDIGVLPVIQFAATTPALQAKQALEPVIEALHGRIGRRILEAWHFPPQLVAVADGHEVPERTTDGTADCTDVVTVANLLAHADTAHRLAAIDWTGVPAATRLGLAGADDLRTDPQFEAAVAAACELLGVPARAPRAPPATPASPVEAASRPAPAVAVPAAAPSGLFARLLRSLGFAR